MHNKKEKRCKPLDIAAEICSQSTHTPNQETIKAIKNAQEGKDRASEAEALAVSQKLDLVR